jgi:hypothetical protein
MFIWLISPRMEAAESMEPPVSAAEPSDLLLAVCLTELPSEDEA